MVRKFIAIGALLLASMFVASAALAVPLDIPIFSTQTFTQPAFDLALAPAVIVDEHAILAELSPSDDVGKLKPPFAATRMLYPDPVGRLILTLDDVGWTPS